MTEEPGLPDPNQQASFTERAKKHAADGEKGVSRRAFLFKVSIAINAAVVALIATPVVRYLLGPIRGKGGYHSWVALGKVDDYRPGETAVATYRNPFTDPWDGETANVACYVRRTAGNKFTVFAVNCAHLNCPVRWFPESELFMCPCHGGVYYADGSRAAGPPERGLFTYDNRVDGNTLMIHAGQMPTLSNEAKLVRGITPCPGTNKPTIG
jgi:menaquinol-cytochrome c reductase iron-sulfur subunit